jgi:hypothetical protein
MPWIFKVYLIYIWKFSLCQGYALSIVGKKKNARHYKLSGDDWRTCSNFKSIAYLQTFHGLFVSLKRSRVSSGVRFKASLMRASVRVYGGPNLSRSKSEMDCGCIPIFTASVYCEIPARFRYVLIFVPKLTVYFLHQFPEQPLNIAWSFLRIMGEIMTNSAVYCQIAPPIS